MRKSPLQITLTDDQRRHLVHLVQSPTAPNGEARRARMVLLFVDGLPIAQIAIRVGLERRIVRRWLTRFAEVGAAGLADKPRPGGRPVFSPRSRDPRGQDRVRTAG